MNFFVIVETWTFQSLCSSRISSVDFFSFIKSISFLMLHKNNSWWFARRKIQQKMWDWNWSAFFHRIWYSCAKNSLNKILFELFGLYTLRSSYHRIHWRLFFMNNPQSSRFCGAFERNQNSYLITWVFFLRREKFTSDLQSVNLMRRQDLNCIQMMWNQDAKKYQKSIRWLSNDGRVWWHWIEFSELYFKFWAKWFDFLYMIIEHTEWIRRSTHVAIIKWIQI